MRKNFQAPDLSLYKIMPQNLEAEESILSSCIISPESLAEVVGILQPIHFYRSSHQKIFQAMTDLFAKGEPVDLVTLANKLKQKDELAVIGGASCLAKLVDTVPIAINAAHYANIIRGKAALRLTIQKSQNIIKSCLEDSDDDVSSIIDTAQREILSIEIENPDDKSYETMADIAEKGFDVLDVRSQNPGKITGVPTGFTQLDMLTWGLQPSDLIIIAARPSAGKSGLACNIARHVAIENNIPVAIFSLEMSKQQLLFRFLSDLAKVNGQKFRSGMFSRDDWSQLSSAGGKIADAPIYIDDEGGLHINQVLRRARRMWKKHGIGLIIIDYLQLMQGDKSETRDREIANITGGLKGLAKELNIPVVALSQLNRALEIRANKRPQMSDLRESGSIENDADIITFIYREEIYVTKKYNDDGSKTEAFEKCEGIAEIIVAKQRNGPVGTVKLAFVDRYASFYNLDKSQDAY